MRFIVLGANGYIGKSVAEALRRHGHSVTGIVRAEEQRAALEALEINVMVGDGLDASFVKTVVSGRETVVSCIASHDLEKIRLVFDAITGAGCQYVYMGGCLDYGDHPNAVIDETVEKNGHFADTRVKIFEDPILRLGAVVLRPGFVYGRSFGNYASAWFTADECVIDGNRHRMYGFIHIDDLAEATCRVLELPWSTIKGEAFDLVDTTRLTFEQVKILFARAAGFKGEPVYKEEASWPQGNISCLSSGLKIQRFTGWHPSHGPLQDEIAVGYTAFKAAKK